MDSETAIYEPSKNGISISETKDCSVYMFNDKSFETLTKYVVKNQYGENVDKTLDDVGAYYHPYKILYSKQSLFAESSCYGFILGSYANNVSNIIVNQKGEIVMNAMIVSRMNDLYDLYIENFDIDTLNKIKVKIPEIHSGRNTINFEEYKIIIDILFDGSEIYSF